MPPQSLTDAVSTLEKRVSLLEPGRLDGLRQKAMLARAELDALAKSRISASSTAAGSSSSSSSSSPGSSAATAAGAAGAAGGAGGISDMSRQKKVRAITRTQQLKSLSTVW